MTAKHDYVSSFREGTNRDKQSYKKMSWPNVHNKRDDGVSPFG